MLNRLHACGLLVLLAAPSLALGQIVLVEDRRHVELSANGETGLETCSDLDEQEPEPFGPEVQGSVGCQTSASEAMAFARLESTFAPWSLGASGFSSALASASPGAAASAFGTSHYIVFFSIDAPASFRLTGRASSDGGEFLARIIDTGVAGGEHVVLVLSHDDLTLLREIGTLAPGIYRFDLEAASLASTAQGMPHVTTTMRARLELSAAPLCEADFDADGDVDADDLGDYINAYFGAAPGGEVDTDGSGELNADDLGDFINAFFSGC
ncbi:MAG: hypothetical protein AB7K52_13560 [Phycisphaerales bacterium]